MMSIFIHAQKMYFLAHHRSHTDALTCTPFSFLTPAQLYTNSSALLKPTGHYIQIAVPDDALFSLVGGASFGFQIVGRMLYSFITRGPSFAVVAASAHGEHLAAATHIMVRANSKSTIEAKYAFQLDTALEALELSQSDRAKGKVVVFAHSHES